MNVPFVDLKVQYRDLKSEIDHAISDVIMDTAFISGVYARRFEEEFGKYLGIDHVVGCANGTDAIEMALKALGIGPGDEVIVPALTWISTSEAVSSTGATPVFVDVLSDRYTMDPEAVERAITQRTRAIIPVHLYGLPAEMEPIMELARVHDLIVIEDAAQAHGATYRGRKAGTIGRIATFSFYPGKNLGAYGDAGCVVTNDDDLARTIRMIANHGQPQKHDHQMEGRNSRLDGIQAAILSVKLPHLDDWNRARRANVARYAERLEGVDVELPHAPDYSEHVFHVFAIRCADRDRVREGLKAAGISTGIHYPTALPFTEAYRSMGHKPEDFPVAYQLPRELLSLPMYPELGEEQIDYVCENLRMLVNPK